MAVSLEDLTPDQLMAYARQAQSSHELFTTLTKNPETRETMQRAIKKLNPNVSIPEIDAADRVMSKVNELAADNVKLRNEMQERDIRARIEAEKAAVRTKYNLTAEDFTGVEALMIDKDNPIPTYDGAARVFLASKQSAVPTSSQFQPPTYEMPEKDVWGAGIGNPGKLNSIAMTEAYKAWNEVSSGAAKH
jgi:hypothetical protein